MEEVVVLVNALVLQMGRMYGLECARKNRVCALVEKRKWFDVSPFCKP
jgi:hypothetical protein